jgi:hypothetical protein
VLEWLGASFRCKSRFFVIGNQGNPFARVGGGSGAERGSASHFGGELAD